jgi:hypothetical protein
MPVSLSMADSEMAQASKLKERAEDHRDLRKDAAIHRCAVWRQLYV